MNTAATISILVFAAATAVHLAGSLRNDRKIRNATKPFILPALAALYLSLTAAPAVTVLLALFFSWLGDVFLMGHGTRYFVIGGVSFMVSHGLFIASYAARTDFSRVSPAAAAGLALFYAAAVCLIFRRLKAHLSRALFYPMFLYLLINGAMNCFAFCRLLASPVPANVLTCAGAVLFFISDTALFFVRFNRDSVMKSHFLVMLTYSIGELLIVLGLI